MFLLYWTPFLGLFSFVHLLEIELISMLPYTLPVESSVVWTGAAMETAVKRANEAYAPHLNISVKYLFNSSRQTCEDIMADTPGMLAEYYYSKPNPLRKCYAVVGALCGDQNALCDLGREWNILVFHNGVAGDAVLKQRRCPTTVAIVGTFDEIMLLMITFLKEKNWYHVSILLDDDATSNVYVVFSATMVKYCRTRPEFYVELLRFSANTNHSMIDALESAKRRSRVLMIMGSTSWAIKLLHVAGTMGMSNGEFVFINIQSTQQGIYGKGSDFNNPSDVYLPIFSYLLFFTSHVFGSELTELNQEVTQTAKDKFGTTYEDGLQPFNLYAVRAAYDMVDVLVKVVNETYYDMENNTERHNGLELASHIYNHTIEITLGSVYFNSKGARSRDVDIYGFDTKSRVMKRFAIYNATNTSIYWIRNITADWPNPGNRLPLDVPVCGFSGLSEVCFRPTLQIVMPPVTGVLATWVLVIILAQRLLRGCISRRKTVSYWWLLTADSLQPLDKSVLGIKPEVRYFNGRQVWCTVVRTQEWLDIKLTLKLKQLVAPIHHSNVNHFYGICALTNEIVLVAKYCIRGSLVDLLEHMNLDWDLKLSLLRDLIQGLTYIHTVTGTGHGLLRKTKCLIDERFTLRIGHLFYEEIKTAISNIAEKKRNSIWLQQEAAKHSNKSKTPAADVFAFASIAITIALGHHHIIGESGEDNLRNHSAFVELPMKLELLFRQCAAPDPTRRPTMKAVAADFRRIDPRSGKKDFNIMDKILTHYTNYTTTLESTILERTELLKCERKKYDGVLEELLPNFIVETLRNNVVYDPERFKSVTIYFGDLVGFTKWLMTGASHCLVLEFLNSFDHLLGNVIRHFDAQKIETTRHTYMVVGGIPIRDDVSHSYEICCMSLSLMERFADLELARDVNLRVGIHTGPCLAGVIGVKVPRYCLFGDSVKIASLVRSYGEGNKVHVSQSVSSLIPKNNQLIFRHRGLVNIKGIGDMNTYWLARRLKHSEYVNLII